MVEGQERLQNTRRSLVLSPNSLPILPRLGQGCLFLILSVSLVFSCVSGEMLLNFCQASYPHFFFFFSGKKRLGEA